MTARWERIFHLFGTMPFPNRTLFNIFPKIPDELIPFGRTPEIISGRVIPPCLQPNGNAFDEEIYVEPLLISLNGEGGNETIEINSFLEWVPVDMKTGVYAFAAPRNSTFRLRVIA
jgi:hypothetical protein